MSTRSDILAEIETALNNITGVGDVFVGKLADVDLDALTLPAVFVWQGVDSESPHREFGADLFRWSPVIEAWCLSADVETLFAAIVAAMKADTTFGGHAIQCRRTGSDVMALDAGRGIIALQQTYEIDYEE